MKKLAFFLLLLLCSLQLQAQDTLDVQLQAVVSQDNTELQILFPIIPIPENTVTVTDSVFMYAEELIVRNINAQFVENTDELGFRIRVHGKTHADRVRYASKCIGYDNETMTARDHRVGLQLVPDSLGNIDATTSEYNCYQKNAGMNALMTYWITAYNDTTIAGVDTTLTTLTRRFYDVAHVLNF